MAEKLPLEPKPLVFPASLKPPPKPDYDARRLKRGALIAETLSSEQAKQREYLICSQDILHWVNNYCFVYEPRDILDNPDKPFFTWGFQDTEFKFLVETLFRCAGAQTPKEAVLYEKSRDMGASWIVLMTFLWFFLFHKGTFLIGSRKEEEVDKTGDMDTPFQKLKYQLLKLEAVFPWLLPPGWDFKRCTGNMIIRHPIPGHGQIVGESSNTEFGRGSRCLAIMLDEFGSWEYATEAWRATGKSAKVRIPVSTPPKSPTQKFARLRNQQDGEVIVRTLHWTMHPEMANDLEVINGKPTSSYYRDECRKSNPEDVAKELDISYALSIKGKVFDRYGYAHQKRDLKPVSNRQIIRVWDPGLHFYVLFGQLDSYERLLFLKEFYAGPSAKDEFGRQAGKGATLDDVAKSVLDISARYFGDYDFVDCGDPYGSYRQVSAQELPEYGVLQRDYGITVHSAFLSRIAPKERVKARISILSRKMQEFAVDTPALLVNPDECPILDRAFGGEYKRKIDINGNIIDQIDEEHPSEDAVDCAGMLALFKCPWGAMGLTRDRTKVRDSKVEMKRPSQTGRGIRIA